MTRRKWPSTYTHNRDAVWITSGKVFIAQPDTPVFFAPGIRQWGQFKRWRRTQPLKLIREYFGAKIGKCQRTLSWFAVQQPHLMSLNVSQTHIPQPYTLPSLAFTQPGSPFQLLLAHL